MTVSDRQTQTDADVIAGAIRDGRIDAKYAPTWLNSLRADNAGTRRVLAALPKAVRASSGEGPSGRGRAAASPVNRTFDEQLAEAAKDDPDLQRTAWLLGVREGVEEPPETYVQFPSDPDEG